MKFTIFLFAAWIFFPLNASAQLQDFSKDMPFFQKKEKVFQRWLDTLGLGSILKVEDVRFQRDRSRRLDTKQIEMYLHVKAADPDSALAQWNSLSRGYTLASGQSLKQDLFNTFVHIMEIPATQGNIQIYTNYKDGRRSSCFFVWLWDDRGPRDSVLVPSKACRAQEFEITIPPVTIKKQLNNGKTKAVVKNQSASEVFDVVMQFMRREFAFDKYKNTTCSGRYPQLVMNFRTDNLTVRGDSGSKEYILSCTVSELCKEAFNYYSLSYWCLIARNAGWQKDCNDIPRERLDFVFTYKSVPSGGYTLNCAINGKYGSAAYVPRCEDYFDMEADFVEALQTYTRNFKSNLMSYLSKP